MKFLIGLTKFILWLVLFFAIIYAFVGTDPNLKIFAVLVFIVCIIVSAVIRRVEKSKLPGGVKGSAIQGVWVLDKHLRFEPNLKKYESLPVAEEKNYFEFKGHNFRSGDFDENRKQLPAEFSPFSINGDNLILESNFFKKANWKWIIKNEHLELTGETMEPYSKSQFIFYKKNWR